MIRITELDCWHANEIIYQADGRTHDGRHVYVRYRRPWFSVGVADTADEAAGADTFVSGDHPDHDPSTINVETLREWCGDQFEWPEEITGYANRPGDRMCRSALTRPDHPD